MVNYPTGYISKPQTEEFENLPETEYRTRLMAKAMGIKTVPFALIKMKDDFVYIMKRMDRSGDSLLLKILATEKLCRLDDRLNEDKYKASYECFAKIVSLYSARKAFDLFKFYLRLVFCLR